MRRKIKAGTTSFMLPIFVRDTSSTAGAGLGSLVHNTAGLVAEYRRRGESSWTAISLVSGTLGTYASGGWVADGSLTGAYEVCIPNAAIASGATFCLVRFRGATNMLPVIAELELDAVDYQDATSFGLSRVDAAVTSRMATYAQPTGFLASTFPTTIASTTNITAATGITLTPTTGLGNQTANITGNVSGAVGSVTGNVGGNVVGSVGSVVSFGTLVTDIWSAGTRSLTTFGTLITDIWSSATRTLTAASDSSGITTLLTRIIGTLAAGTHEPQSGDSYSRLGSPVGASIAADIQTRLASASYTAPLDAAGTRNALGMASANLDSQLNSLGSAIVTTSGYIDTEITTILNRLPASLVDGRMDVSVGAMADNVITASALASDAVTEITDSVAAISTITNLDSMLEVALGGAVSFNAYALAASKEFTSNQVLTLLSILGIPDLGTTPENPTEGVLFNLTEELAQVIKSGEEVTHVRTGKTNVIETVTRN